MRLRRSTWLLALAAACVLLIIAAGAWVLDAPRRTRIQQQQELQAHAQQPDAEQRTRARAERVQRFLTQPFLVAEGYMGVPGAAVPLHDTLAQMQAPIAGQYDHLPVAALSFVGGLELAAAKAQQLAG